MENEDKPGTGPENEAVSNVAPTSVQDAAGQVQSIFGPIQQMLEAIRVPDRIEFDDIYGNVYSVRPVMNTDRWLDVMIMMGRVGDHVTDEYEHIRKTVALNTAPTFGPSTVDAETGEETPGEETPPTWSVMHGVIWAVTRACSDNELRSSLNDLFVTIHPKVMARARDAARDAGDDYASSTALFEPHELARGLLPFFARAATKTGQVVADYTPTDKGLPILSPPSEPSLGLSSAVAMT